MITKESAILTLEHAGWNISRPDDIKVDEAKEDTIFLSQAGNGEWIITSSGSITFFESGKDPNSPPSLDRFSW